MDEFVCALWDLQNADGVEFHERVVVDAFQPIVAQHSAKKQGNKQFSITETLLHTSPGLRYSAEQRQNGILSSYSATSLIS